MSQHHHHHKNHSTRPRRSLLTVGAPEPTTSTVPMRSRFGNPRGGPRDVFSLVATAMVVAGIALGLVVASVVTFGILEHRNSERYEKLNGEVNMIQGGAIYAHSYVAVPISVLSNMKFTSPNRGLIASPVVANRWFELGESVITLTTAVLVTGNQSYVEGRSNPAGAWLWDGDNGRWRVPRTGVYAVFVVVGSEAPPFTLDEEGSVGVGFNGAEPIGQCADIAYGSIIILDTAGSACLMDLSAGDRISVWYRSRQTDPVIVGRLMFQIRFLQPL